MAKLKTTFFYNDSYSPQLELLTAKSIHEQSLVDKFVCCKNPKIFHYIKVWIKQSQYLQFYNTS